MVRENEEFEVETERAGEWPSTPLEARERGGQNKLASPQINVYRSYMSGMLRHSSRHT